MTTWFQIIENKAQSATLSFILYDLYDQRQSRLLFFNQEKRPVLPFIKVYNLVDSVEECFFFRRGKSKNILMG